MDGGYSISETDDNDGASAINDLMSNNSALKNMAADINFSPGTQYNHGSPGAPNTWEEHIDYNNMTAAERNNKMLNSALISEMNNMKEKY